MDREEHLGSGDDDEDHSEDQGHEGEEEYEQEDPEEVILRDYDGDRSAYMRDHPFAFGGHDGDVSELLARLDPAILASVPHELLSGLDPAALAGLLDRSERRMAGGPGGGGSSGSRSGSSDQPPSGPPPPPDTNFEDNPSAVLAAISHPLTDPDTLVMALTSLSMMVLMNQRGIQPSRFVSHICKCFVRKDMPQFIQEMCLQVPLLPSQFDSFHYLHSFTHVSGARQFPRSRRHRTRFVCWPYCSRDKRPCHHAIYAGRASLLSRLP